MLPGPYRAKGARSRQLEHVGWRLGDEFGPKTASRIFLPPGIGDLHWIMMKMRSFTQLHLGGQRPDVWLMDAGDKNRASEYVARCPSVRYCGTYGPQWGGWLHMEMLHRSGVLQNTDGFDWILCANPHLERDGNLATWLPDCEIAWEYELEERDGDADLAEEVLADGPYVLASFFRDGWYADHYLSHFDTVRIAAALRQIARRHRVLLTGASWDIPFLSEIAVASGVSVELVGKTSCAQLLSLLRRCSGYVGHPAGNGIMATHFRVPTVLLWSSTRHRHALWHSWVRPGDHGIRYQALDVVGLSIDQVVEACAWR